MAKGIVQNSRKENQYLFALPIEDEFKENLLLVNIAESPHINNVLRAKILATLKIAFLNSPVKIIICIGITQYRPKEQRNQLIEEAHSSAIGGYKGSRSRFSKKFNKKNG